ncbi:MULTISPECIES: DinB/UmuC family translesion DNA polymerase [Bradyrhizobium]|uniref:DinB/UmuC family translesion DNA polymerase n=1 Tax=Bradyrhizobium elkanii TaxID=29448 RepID=UPI00048235F0|nr:hypothetical protein [Bradyrhizobium elkanii]
MDTHGIDERPVRANRIRKSLGAENTFSEDLAEYDAPAAELKPLIEKVSHHCEATGARGGTATLRVKFSDCELITRSKSIGHPYRKRSSTLAQDPLKHLMPPKKPIQLLGIAIVSVITQLLRCRRQISQRVTTALDV